MGPAFHNFKQQARLTGHRLHGDYLGGLHPGGGLAAIRVVMDARNSAEGAVILGAVIIAAHESLAAPHGVVGVTVCG